MFDPSGFRAAEIEFDKVAKIVGSHDAVISLATDATVTDLVIMSHGWNNDIAEARDLYTKLAAVLRAVADGAVAPALTDRVIALVGLFWPSKKFTNDELIPGGAAGAGTPNGQSEVQLKIEQLREIFTDDASQDALNMASGLVSQLEDDPDARTQFAEALLSMLDRGAAEDEDGTTDMFEVSPTMLMERLAVPAVIAPPEPDADGGFGQSLGVEAGDSAGAGAAAGVGSTLGGWLGSATNLLNGVTYYQMKARSGTVGELGLAKLITNIRNQRSDLRIHLVGHSFGGRLVTAAASRLPKDTLASMTLLQAAFSHYGFSPEYRPDHVGAFRAVVSAETISGPVAITHTRCDRAVGLWYAIASRVAGQQGAFVGDAKDAYGGIGRNGAQKTPEAIATRLLDVGDRYTWAARRLHNLRADDFIHGHSDIKNVQVAYVILSMIAAT